MVDTRTHKRRQCFAKNLDRLIRSFHLSRKDAANEIGVPYKLIRRMVSAGISRPDKRSLENLGKIAAYFALPNVEDFWREDFIDWLATAKEAMPFVKKFRSHVLDKQAERMSVMSDIYLEMDNFFGTEFGFEKTPPEEEPQRKFLLNKVSVILESEELKHFEKVIEVYYQRALRKTSGKK